MNKQKAERYCKCRIKNPTGIWHLEQGQGYADCQCGKRYKTNL